MGPLGHSVAALAALGAAPVALGALAARPAWRVGFRERLGARPSTPPGAVWIHGASVGEIGAATALMDRLLEAGDAVVASTMTVTGRDLLRRTRPGIPCALAPLDHPWCVRMALRRVQACALVFVETELWPSWILAADASRVPVLVASARISERSHARYRRVAPLLRPILGRIAAIGARSDRDAERFAELGARADRIQVTGDLKFESPREPPKLAAPLEAALAADVPLVVAGSTHEGEEAAALRALERSEAAGCRAALVLAPRHPERCREVAQLVTRSGRTLKLRSALDPGPLEAGDVLVLDSVGELPGVYAHADVVFVGGSLAPRGGHNLVEPAMLGRAVLFGPDTRNTSQAAELLVGVGAGKRVPNAEALGAAVTEALRDPGAWAARGARGAEALAPHRGAAERTLELLRRVRSARMRSTP